MVFAFLDAALPLVLPGLLPAALYWLYAAVPSGPGGPNEEAM